MSEMIRAGEPVFDDLTPVEAPELNEGVKGLVPRDYSLMPVRAYGAVSMPVLSMEEIKARAEQMAREESRLSDIYLRAGWENLNQNGHGYCWMYAATHALMLLRDVQHQAPRRLSAHACAAKIKGGKDEGGWSALGLDWLFKTGAPRHELWPTHSRAVNNWTPEVEADAAGQRVTEGWFDAAAPVYDRDLSWQQVLTLLVCRVPVPCDFNWWGHAVCVVDAVVMPDGSMGVRLLNSWLNWGQRGLGVLSGSKARPDNAVAPRVAVAS